MAVPQLPGGRGVIFHTGRASDVGRLTYTLNVHNEGPDAAAGRGGAMTTDVPQRRYLTAYRRDCC